MNGVARPVTGPISGPSVPVPVRRVRHQVRDGIAVMAFSAAASAGVAAALLLLSGIGK